MIDARPQATCTTVKDAGTWVAWDTKVVVLGRSAEQFPSRTARRADEEGRLTVIIDTKDGEKGKPLNEVNNAFQEVVRAIGDRAMDTARQKITDATDTLTDIAAGSGSSDGGRENGAGMFKRAFSGVKNKAKSVLPGSRDDEGNDGD